MTKLLNTIGHILPIEDDQNEFAFFETKNTPILQSSTVRKEALVGEADTNEFEEERLNFLSTTFRINTTPGSEDSVKWLKQMKNAKNLEIFRTKL